MTNSNAPADPPMSPADTMLSLFELETLDINLYRGARDPEARGRVFGGQVIGQALAAAERTVPTDRAAHSLHAYFVRAGDDALPIIYRVERDRDGGSFSNRRVIAQQNGETILNMITSFHAEEEGLSHQDAMPDVPMPEDLKTDAELADELTELPEMFRWFMRRPRGVDLKRTSIDVFGGEPTKPEQHVWFRFNGQSPEEQGLHRAILAYSSDFSLLGTAMLPHGVHWSNPGVKSASIDHAVWFHGPVDMGEWHLHTMRSGWSGGSRGHSTGQIFSRDGRLVASTVQEGLMRYRPPNGGK
ncbi:MAG: acyl-CoA thioesterase II [Pseudomonadota bacterium]